MLKTEEKQIKESLFKFLESIYKFEKYEEKNFGLNWDEIYLLQILIRSPGLCVTEISTKMKVKPFVASRMLNKMEELGLTKKANDKNDKRIFHQYVTDNGRKIINQIDDFNYSVVVSQLEKMTEEHSQFIISILDNLGELLKLPKENE